MHGLRIMRRQLVESNQIIRCHSVPTNHSIANLASCFYETTQMDLTFASRIINRDSLLLRMMLELAGTPEDYCE